MLGSTMSHVDPTTANGAQRDSLDDFSTLFAFLPVGAYRSLPNGQQLRANPALVRLNGYDDEAQMLAGVRNIALEWYVNPERRSEFRRELESHGHVRGFVSEIYRHRTRERIWISENAHVVRGADGQVLYYEGTVEDITERVQAAQAVQRSEAHLRQIAQHVPGMVYRVHTRPDGRARYSFVSEGVRELYGIAPQQLIDDARVLRRFRHVDDAAQIEEAVAAAMSSRAPLTLRYRVRLDNGRIKWLQMSSSAATQEGDEQVRVGVLVDVTASYEAASLRDDRDRAQAAQQEMTQFLLRVSHELRTPLNAILGFAQLLATDAGVAPTHREWVREVLASGRHLLGLVDDILDLSGAQSGQMTMDLTRFELLPALQECITMLAAEAAAMQLPLQLPQPVTPLPAVLADRRRVKQVLSNLLSNAIKYNRRRGTLTLSARAQSAFVELDVCDSGAGLDAAQLARLFNPFERLGAQRGTVPGTGLGLALSRQLATAMGGDIRVRSQPGQGSTFTLVLPAAPPPSAPSAS